MPRFLTYLEYGDDQPKAMSEAEFKANGQPDNWEEYVWQDVADAETALARHYVAMEAYEADNKYMRPIKHTY